MALITVLIDNSAQSWFVPADVWDGVATFERYQPGGGGADNIDGGKGGGGGGYARWENISVVEGDEWVIDPAEGGFSGEDAGVGYIWNSTANVFLSDGLNDDFIPSGGNGNGPHDAGHYGEIGARDDGYGSPVENIAGGNGANGPNGAGGDGAGTTGGPDGIDYSTMGYVNGGTGHAGFSTDGQFGVVLIHYYDSDPDPGGGSDPLYSTWNQNRRNMAMGS